MITKNANARFSTVPREIADVGRTGGACVIHGVGVTHKSALTVELQR